MGELQIMKAGSLLNDHPENKRDKCFYVPQTARMQKHIGEMFPHWHIYKPLLPLSVFNNS